MSQSNIDILKNMTLEELWELFHIILVPHNPEWKEWATEEILSLNVLLADFTPIINHIGSTAIPGIMAKPIVDILVEISPDCDWRAVREMLENAGYICMSESKGRMSFNKGYTPKGYADRVFHVHIQAIGDNEEIRFRDYLIKSPSVAKEYEALKQSLLPKYRNDRDGYTESKSDFVSEIILLLLIFGSATVNCRKADYWIFLSELSEYLRNKETISDAGILLHINRLIRDNKLSRIARGQYGVSAKKEFIPTLTDTLKKYLKVFIMNLL